MHFYFGKKILVISHNGSLTSMETFRANHRMVRVDPARFGALICCRFNLFILICLPSAHNHQYLRDYLGASGFSLFPCNLCACIKANLSSSRVCGPQTGITLGRDFRPCSMLTRPTVVMVDGAYYLSETTRVSVYFCWVPSCAHRPFCNHHRPAQTQRLHVSTSRQARLMQGAGQRS